MQKDGAVENAETLVPQEALERVDLSVPDEYKVEFVAVEMVQHLTEYHKLVDAQKAARQVEDHKRAEECGRLIVYLRNLIALQQHQNPKAKAIANNLMESQARMLVTNRSRAEAEK